MVRPVAPHYLDQYKPSEPQDCYLCGAREFDIINEQDRYGFYYPTGLCMQCGNVQQIMYYPETVLSEFYKNDYRNIYGNPPASEFFRQQRKQGKRIYEFVKDELKHEFRVLEVGAGAGGILSVFQEKGHKVLGIDFDEHYMEYGRSQGIDLREEQNCKADCIIMSHVLEHIPYPKRGIGEVLRHLAPNGFIYIELPSLDLVRDDYSEYHHDLSEYWQNAHCIHFTAKTFAAFCGLCGLRIEKGDEYIRAIVRRSTDLDCGEDTRKILREIKRNGLKDAVREAYWKGRRVAVAALDKVGLKERVRQWAV